MSDQTPGDDRGGDRVPDAVATALADADRAVALTGAGVSTASGIPAFRDEGGIWEQFDPKAFHRRRLEAEPGEFWRDRLELREAIFGDGVPAPNAAHEALADLERAGHLDAVLTQNTDGLHGDAGSERVVELHGTAREVRCDDCGRRSPADPVFDRAADGDLPPRCDCGGVLRPAVVLFGEDLPDDRFAEASSLARDADWLLAAGSSLSVRPAAQLPRMAVDGGATLVVVNLSSTPADVLADHVLQADVTSVLPALAERVTGE